MPLFFHIYLDLCMYMYIHIFYIYTQRHMCKFVCYVCSFQPNFSWSFSDFLVLFSPDSELSALLDSGELSDLLLRRWCGREEEPEYLVLMAARSLDFSCESFSFISSFASFCKFANSCLRDASQLILVSSFSIWVDTSPTIALQGFTCGTGVSTEKPFLITTRPWVHWGDKSVWKPLPILSPTPLDLRSDVMEECCPMTVKSFIPATAGDTHPWNSNPDERKMIEWKAIH